eukprot:c16403_g1_i2.p1 GENE.c16403_g1_i2~~c16403_g1_i2.p1  ORF type:complete len:130 (-),score=31.73 c16403_g1_i2:25-414(-)
MSKIPIKVHYRGEIRYFWTTKLSYADLRTQLIVNFEINNPSCVRLSFLDMEKDKVIMKDDRDSDEAFRQFAENKIPTLNVYVDVLRTEEVKVLTSSIAQNTKKIGNSLMGGLASLSSSPVSFYFIFFID